MMWHLRAPAHPLCPRALTSLLSSLSHAAAGSTPDGLSLARGGCCCCRRRDRLCQHSSSCGGGHCPIRSLAQRVPGLQAGQDRGELACLSLLLRRHLTPSPVLMASLLHTARVTQHGVVPLRSARPQRGGWPSRGLLLGHPVSSALCALLSAPLAYRPHPCAPAAPTLARAASPWCVLTRPSAHPTHADTSTSW